jgi:hypothetical protein
VRVFLSYSHKDSDLAETISAALQTQGVDVWKADKEITPGSDLSLSIREGMGKSDAIFVLLSKHALESANVMAEVYWALARTYENKPQKFIPITIQKDVELPPFLRNLRYYYLDQSRDISKQISSIVPQIESSEITDYSQALRAQQEHLESQLAALSDMKLQQEKRSKLRSTYLSMSVAVVSVIASVISFLFSSRFLSGFHLEWNSFIVGLEAGVVIGSMVGAVLLATSRRVAERKEQQHD